MFGGPPLPLGGAASQSMDIAVEKVHKEHKDIHIVRLAGGTTFRIVITPKTREARYVDILAEGLVPGNPGAVTSYYPRRPSEDRFSRAIGHSLQEKIDDLRTGNGEPVEAELLQELVEVGRIKSVELPYFG